MTELGQHSLVHIGRERMKLSIAIEDETGRAR